LVLRTMLIHTGGESRKRGFFISFPFREEQKCSKRLKGLLEEASTIALPGLAPERNQGEKALCSRTKQNSHKKARPVK